MAESVSKLRDELLSLTGVDIQLDEDTFKSTYDILKELSEVWDSLTDVSRANVTELIAGKRQGNIISALMTNFDIAEQVSNTSANRSQGSAQKELENFQKGIEYSIGRFKASFQEMATDFISSDLVKGVVDFGTALMNVLDASIGKFGALRTVLAGLGVTAYIKDIMGLRSAIDGLIDRFVIVNTITGSPLKTAQYMFSSLAESIGLSTAALGGFLAAAAGLIAIVAILEKIHITADEALDSFTKQRDSFDNAKMEVDDLNAQLEETQSKIDALEAKGNLSLVEQEDLSNLKQQNIQLQRTLQLKEAQLKLEARQTGHEAHKLYNEWTTNDNLFGNGESNSYDASKIEGMIDSDEIVKNTIDRIRQNKPRKNEFEIGAVGSQWDDFDLETNKDNINSLIAAYASYEKQYEAAIIALSEYDDEITDAQTGEISRLEAYRDEMEANMLDTQSYIDGYASVMQQVKDAYTGMQDLDIDLTSVQRNELIEAEKFLVEYRKMVDDSAAAIQEDLDKIFSSSDNKQLFNKIKEAYSEGNIEAVHEIIEGNEQLKEAYGALGITAGQVFDYIANKIDPDSLNISAIKEQLHDAFVKDEPEDIAKEFSEKFYEFLGDKSDEEIEIFYRYVSANNINLTDLLPEDLEATFSLAMDAKGAVNVDKVADAFNEATSNSSGLLTTINDINSAISSIETGKALDPDTFNADNLKDYRDALEYVNGSMQYNTDMVKQINEAKVQEQIESNNVAKALEQEKWAENKKKIIDYENTLKSLDEESTEYKSTLASINSLQSENDDIVDRCSYLDLYNQKLRESIGAYQDWLDAQNGGEAGDMSSDVQKAIKNVTDVFDTESDEYGKAYTNKYTAAVEFLIPDEVSAEGQEAIKNYVDNLGQYFNGEKGGVDKFIQEGIDKGFFNYDADSGELSVVGETYADIADKMGWTEEAVQAMMGLVHDYTGLTMEAENFADATLLVNQALDDAGYSVQELSEMSDVDLSAALGVEDTSQLEAARKIIDEMGTSAEASGEKAETAAKGYGEFADAVAMKRQAREGIVSSEHTTQPHEDVGAGDTTETVETTAVVQKITVADAVNMPEVDVIGIVKEALVDSGLNPPEADVIGNVVDCIVENGIEAPTVDAYAQIIEYLAAENQGGVDVDVIGKIIEVTNNGFLPQVDVNGKINLNSKDVQDGVGEVRDLVSGVDGLSATTIFDGDTSPLSTAKGDAQAIIDSVPSEKTVTFKGVMAPTLAGFGVHGVNGTAHFRGTAYAQGNWSASRDETALVGELGREIVVDSRTGKWRTVGDNGAEFARIHRGDIVFNHKQSEELLSRGFVSGRGSALLYGTAYAGGVNDLKYSGVGNWKPSSSSSSTTANTSAQEANTKATKSNTKAKKDSTKKTKKLNDLYDWVAVRLQYFADKTKEIADQINDYISSALKSSLLSRQISANQNEIGANNYAAILYKQQADTVARQMKMSKKLINKAQTGAWQFENLSDKNQEKVQTYLKYYDKYKEAQSKVTDLRNEQLKLYEDFVNIPSEEAAKNIDKITRSVNLLGKAYDIASTGGSALLSFVKEITRTSTNTDAAKIAREYAGLATYFAQNKYLDEQLDRALDEVNEYEAAYNQTVINTETAGADITNTANASATARNAVSSRASSILGNKKLRKKLSKAQIKALQSGQVVNTKGLSGNVLKKIKQYNALVADATTRSQAADDAITKYGIATEAQEAALQEFAESQESYAQQIVDNEQKKFNNIKSYYDTEISMQKTIAENFEKQRELEEAYGQDLTEELFTKQIDAMRVQRQLLEEQEEALKQSLKDSMDKGLISEGTEEWMQMKTQILSVNSAIDEMDVSILKLQDEMRKNVFYQALDKALKKAEQLRSAVSTIKDIISEEMMFDDDGMITNMGITALAMNVKEYESYLDSMGTLLEKRQKYIDDFNDGKNATNYSEKEFEEDMADITEEIQNLLKNATNARSAIIEIVKKTSSAELDAIYKVIDARKELLKKQKDYYDYDKSLKEKTKDIQLLEQQERALQNSTAAEDKAALARIRAQRIEAQEALDDTVRTHVYDLQVDGLDDLKTELRESYDNYVKDLSRNLDLITKTVDGATDTVNNALNTVNSSIQTLLNSYGVNGLTNDAVGLPHFAGGSRRIGRNTYGLTNERGGEIVIGDRGVFVPLTSNSSVLKPDLTNRIFSLADNYNSIMGMVGSKYVASAIQGNEGSIAPIINAPITISGSRIDEQGVIRAINKQLPIISKTVQDDIRKDLRKSR